MQSLNIPLDGTFSPAELKELEGIGLAFVEAYRARSLFIGNRGTSKVSIQAVLDPRLSPNHRNAIVALGNSREP
jgi:hypothetical protein